MASAESTSGQSASAWSTKARLGFTAATVVFGLFVVASNRYPQALSLAEAELKAHQCAAATHDTSTSSPGNPVDFMQFFGNISEPRAFNFSVCLNGGRWVQYDGSHALHTSVDGVSEKSLGKLCGQHGGQCVNFGVVSGEFWHLLQLNHTVPCDQLLVFRSALRAALAVLNEQPIPADNLLASAQANTNLLGGAAGLQRIFTESIILKQRDSLFAAALALKAAVVLACAARGKDGMCAPEHLFAALPQLLLDQRGEVPMAFVHVFDTVQDAARWDEKSAARFAGTRHAECGLLPPVAGLEWGPRIGLSESLSQIVPVVREDEFSTLGSLGPGFVPAAVRRNCGSRMGHLVLLPSDLSSVLQAAPSQLALLISLLVSRELSVVVGPKTVIETALHSLLRSELHFDMFNVHVVDSPGMQLRGSADAEAAAVDIFIDGNVKYVGVFDFRGGADVTLQSLRPCGLQFHDSLSQTQCALAQLRLQLCKWHPAVGVVGSPQQSTSAGEDGYDLTAPVMDSKVLVYDVDVLRYVYGAHGTGSPIDVLDPRLLLDAAGRRQVRAVRAAALAALFAQYTMLVPHVFHEAPVSAPYPSTDASAARALGAGLQQELAAAHKAGGCGLGLHELPAAANAIACALDASEEACTFKWQACRRIGNSFRFGVARACSSNSSSLLGRLVHSSTSFLNEAQFAPSTLGVAVCMRVAMGFFGLFTHWDKIGPIHASFVEPHLRPHMVFALPPGSNIAHFESFVPGSVLMDVESKLSLDCWLRKIGLTKQKVFSVKSNSNMLSGLKPGNQHAFQQYRDHLSIRLMVDLMELSYGIKHDFYMIQRNDVLWLRSPFPDTPEWRLGVPPPPHSCLMAGPIFDSRGIEDRVALCDRAGFDAYTSAAEMFATQGVDRVVADVMSLTHFSDAESFLLWRLKSHNISLPRDDSVYTRTCGHGPPKKGEPLTRMERNHHCYWQTGLNMWFVDAKEVNKASVENAKRLFAAERSSLGAAK